MGWKGVLRSAVAASRAAERERNRRNHALQRGVEKIDRIVDQLETEIDRDLSKVQKIEARIIERPISASGVRFDHQERRWHFKEIRDDTGTVNWGLTIEFGRSEASAIGLVEDGGRTYEFVALAATRWAVFVAFRITTTSTEKSTKLFNKRDSSANRVMLKNNGVFYRALEGQLDIELPIPGSAIGLAAFPVPTEMASDVSFEFLLKRRSASIPLQISEIDLFTRAAQSPSLAAQVQEKFAAQTAPLKAQALETKAALDRKKSSGGSGLVLIVIIILVVMMIAGLSN
jgi:hypothetical protein